jgi:spore maturation protein CgeB
MNQRLIKHVEETKPDLLFCYLLSEELKKETIDFITKKTKTKTFNWFADDHWRVPIFSRYWAPLFTMVSTTDSEAPAIYKSYGINNVIKTQWGANPHLYFPQDEIKNPGNLEVSFVGQSFGKRPGYVRALENQGVKVQTFGKGWQGGRIDHQKMLEVFNYSKINLNFPETYYYGFSSFFKRIAKLFIAREMGKYKFTGHHFFDNWKSMQGTQKKCIKGRVFEVPAAGGFLLTGESDDSIAEYYVPGKEIAVYKDENELVEKVKYYLSHEEVRKAIAHAGFNRTMKDHTYQKRFEQIFKAMSLM